MSKIPFIKAKHAQMKLIEGGGGGGGTSLVLIGLVVYIPPDTTQYRTGIPIMYEGMVLMAQYEDNYYRDVTDIATYSIPKGTILEDDYEGAVVFSYEEGSTRVQTSLDITVMGIKYIDYIEKYEYGVPYDLGFQYHYPMSFGVSFNISNVSNNKAYSILVNVGGRTYPYADFGFASAYYQTLAAYYMQTASKYDIKFNYVGNFKDKDTFVKADIVNGRFEYSNGTYPNAALAPGFEYADGGNVTLCYPVNNNILTIRIKYLEIYDSNMKTIARFNPCVNKGVAGLYEEFEKRFIPIVEGWRGSE